MEALRIEGLKKKFGETEVIRELSFSVPEHSVFGFIGKNGAGKTTTMKMILGLLKPDAGKIQVFGESVSYGETKTNRFTGYLPDVPEFYSYMTASEYLRLCGEIAGLASGEIRRRSAELLELVGLTDNKKRVGGYSRGMKQRLGIAQALLGNPRLLICDEPTSALDPVGRKEILDILFKLKGRTTVIFSTHILTDVERICDRVGVLSEGRIVLSGEMEALKKQYAQDKVMMEFPKEKQEEVLAVLKAQHLEPLHTEVVEPSLEKLFLEVI
ncbi:ABC transporter ATP-binding protein [Bariatricus massiliensis]|uniref:ABC transporter ATP-binding protein n=1 Tax=Bariatricus massiliensis TaxID=1745713 RepID=A0ABS8DD49_9FIRM|nr:ABC transporter ATP-binding protein [Bariatricus massiliensis]MCB7303539.1 ABC transporter ATP-binding protein [Bariatricus massiliensis]MCB7373671.1 ABC transporter ATP-binding protein [Bariatricus massiliensis]MCB7386341.1 ABC transporter ATP-binding protein [Bariatricus massiliensis]MCB7410503.1 ABC transporter ATP-binding protein [Bariatricus massiliensis]MCQ5252213.1 ABC transporter ATP-binding protein [Bariatricus massiliensis]